jgi:pimeloyl-ACP methyl ester carboxylesterase
MDRTDYTMEAFSADVRAVLDEQDLQYVILIGHSMGGAVMVEAALGAPERVIGLVGVDNFQDVSQKLPPEQIAAFKAQFAADFKGTCTAWIGSMFPADADSNLKNTIISDMCGAPPSVALGALSKSLEWYGAGPSTRLEKLDVPLMCINADLRPTNVEAVKAVVPAYQLRVMPGCGHFLMREDPREFNRLLAETIAAMTEM